MRQRAELLTHVQQPTHQDNLPEIGQKIADTAHREGVAERVPAPAVQHSIAVDLALIASYDPLRTTLERDLVQSANAHEAQTCSRLRARPGVGTILALVLLDEIPASHRFPRVQEGVSSGRLVKGAQEAAGQRDGPSGKKIGKASLTWAFADAAGLCWRNNPAGQRERARLEKTQSTGKARTVLAPTLARAVDDMVKRDPAVALDKFGNGSWRGVSEPAASRAAAGIRLASEC
jgi:hypothetical protein